MLQHHLHHRLGLVLQVLGLEVEEAALLVEAEELTGGPDLDCFLVGLASFLQRGPHKPLHLTLGVDVRVGRGGGELLGEEGGLAHRHLAAGPDVEQGVADLEAVGGDPVGRGLLAPVHLELVGVEPVALHVQPLPLARGLPLPPASDLAQLPAGELEEERVAEPGAEEEVAGAGEADAGGEHRGGRRTS